MSNKELLRLVGAGDKKAIRKANRMIAHICEYKYCGRKFYQKRPDQKYHNTNCRQAEYYRLKVLEDQKKETKKACRIAKHWKDEAEK